MREFQVLDEKRYPLKTVSERRNVLDLHSRIPETDMLPFWRWEHRVTVGHNTREYMVFLDTLNNLMYVEEITGGHLTVIDDDPLRQAIVRFVQEKGFVNIAPPLLKPTPERFC